MEAITSRAILNGIEETKLEDVLEDFAKQFHADSSRHAKYVKATQWDALDDLVARHFRATQVPALSVRGRHLPLLYRIISTLVSPPCSMCVFVLDLEGRFDATRLTCAEDDLQHVYIQQPDRDGGGAPADRGASMVAEAEAFMLYSQTTRISMYRQWWGSIVVGGAGTSTGGDLVAGWRGWLRVDREHVPEFAPGTTVEAAYERRSARQEAVDASGWAATSPWGSLTFHEEA